MELVVLGNSVSAGTGLADPSNAWPNVVAREIEERLGEAVPVRNIVFAPMGGGAADFALRRIGDGQNAIVVVALGSYVCAIGTVSERIRQRWGRRMAQRYDALERRFEAGTGNRGQALGRVNGLGRWLTRRIIGVAKITTVDDVIDVYTRVLAGLAQREHTEVIVFAEPLWPERIDRENAGANEAFRQIRSAVREVAARHHFRWADPEPGWSEVPDRNVHYLSDGTHKTVAAHRLMAEAVIEQARLCVGAG